MSDLEPRNVLEDDQPLSVRRKRRSSTALSHSRNNSQNSLPNAQPHGIATPPETPKRAKKRVRFSDPGPALNSSPSSSGLTPFIRRTSLTTPKSKRRHSTPSTLSNRIQYDDTPISGTLQFAPLRQVLEGRVKRRIKRNRLSEEINVIEWEKRVEAREKRSELERLRKELQAKDLEVQSMREEQDIATQIEGESGGSITMTTKLCTRVQELEQEICVLKAELQRRESDNEEDPNWTMAARDPFDFDEDDDNMITNYDDDFIDSEMITTPTRLNTSFPSPPCTTPNTPCKSTSSNSAAVQACLSDPEKEELASQLQTLQSEISKLTSSIAFNEDHQARLAGKLSEFMCADESGHRAIDAALDSVLTQLVLSQSKELESSIAFEALSSEIASLGFPASSPDEALSLIASQFRQARLDLEHISPGEFVEGFENSKLLEMLVSRLRDLAKKVKEQDDSIDQYHEQELLLRQQIDTRVNVMDKIRGELVLANTTIGDLKREVSEKDIGNERLSRALEGYREEVKGLEELIERVEREAQITEESLRSEVADLENRLCDQISSHEVTKADNEGKEMLVSELESRLKIALQAAAEVQEQLTGLTSSLEVKDATIAKLQVSMHDREKAHGEALALRDARVMELREEIERINTSLKIAHETILSLRKENGELKAQVEGEKTRGQFVVQSMREQLSRALETGVGYVNGEVSVQGPSVGVVQSGDDGVVRREPPATGRLFDAGLARRGSGKGKRRRRYDSGLGFLEEESEGEMGVGV